MRMHKYLLIAGLATLLTACGSEPASVVKEFYDDIGNGKIQEAKQFVNPSVQRKYGEDVDAGLEIRMREYNNAGGYKGVTLSDENSNGDNYSAKATIHTGSGKDIVEPVRMLKVNGKWVM